MVAAWRGCGLSRLCGRWLLFSAICETTMTMAAWRRSAEAAVRIKKYRDTGLSYAGNRLRNRFEDDCFRNLASVL